MYQVWETLALFFPSPPFQEKVQKPQNLEKYTLNLAKKANRAETEQRQDATKKINWANLIFILWGKWYRQIWIQTYLDFIVLILI